MQSIAITPVLRPIRGAVRPPGSKSLTNRALIVAALAKGTSQLNDVLESVDTTVMVQSLRQLGIEVASDPGARRFHVTGATQGLAPQADLWCENSGTSIRFLAALVAAAGRGRYRLDGNARMRERPIGPLLEALQGAGVTAVSELGNQCPPLLIETQGLTGGTIQVSGHLSSQYLSGLLMAAPCSQETLTIEVIGELVSRPYVDMTLQLMRDFGANVTEPTTRSFRVAPGGYLGRDYAIEPDASAASYFFGAAAVTGGTVTVEGLSRRSLQGDVRFVEALEQMGCRVGWNADSISVTGTSGLRGVDIDMNDISDTAQTLACVAPFAAGPTRIRNVAHMRLKETDRVEAVVTELRRCGQEVEEHPDGLTIHPRPITPALIHTYDDHRMAMSFALLGLRAEGIEIADPGCTAKTYPHFFDDLEHLCRAAR